MAPIRIVFYRNSRGRLPALDWLRELRQRDAALYVHVAAALQELGACGRALGPPLCLRAGDGLYLLRPQAQKPCTPILYFFHGHGAVALGPVRRGGDPLPMVTLVSASHLRREFERDPWGRSHEEVVESEDL